MKSNNKKEVQEEEEQKGGQKHGKVQKFNPQKLPRYLGICLEKQDKAKQMITKWVKDGLQLLVDAYPDNYLISQNLQQFTKTFSDPEDFHITCCFIGGNEQKKTSDAFKTFQPNKEISVDIYAFAYIPNKIIAGVCYPDRNKICIENDYPHVTLFLGEWQAYQSNQLLEALFQPNVGPLCKVYNKQYLESQNGNQTSKFELKVLEKKNKVQQDIYFVKTDEILKFQGITKVYQ